MSRNIKTRAVTLSYVVNILSLVYSNSYAYETSTAYEVKKDRRIRTRNVHMSQPLI